MPEGAFSFTLRVDGVEVEAEELGGRVVLAMKLTENEELYPVLAQYAAGRMLREEATLAYGKEGLILWQDASGGEDARGLERLFETFMDSCDWWRARLEALAGSHAAEGGPEPMMIRP